MHETNRTAGRWQRGAERYRSGGVIENKLLSGGDVNLKAVTEKALL
jgi:hypothetical protein